jgi:hypothetical protein
MWFDVKMFPRRKSADSEQVFISEQFYVSSQTVTELFIG